MKNQYIRHSITFLLMLTLSAAFGQISFTKVTDPLNAISSHPPSSNYTGATWVDYDSDQDFDLFVNSHYLYRNDGAGIFVQITNPGFNFTQGLGNGNSWGDMDNDGDPDLARVNSQSAVFENQDSIFQKHMDPPFDNLAYRGWSTAWGDYDSDGFLDLLMVHPQGFLGASQKNRLFNNNGDGRFTEVFNDVTADFSAYTGVTWTDFDLDGDQDVFIGSGQVNTLSKDDIFINTLTETGVADLVRLDTGVLATDLRDGQNWNWVDYDNDGDLDGFVTNYNGPKTNDFYRNDGNYQFVKLTTAEIGNIVNQTGAGLGNLWGDFDNDGDLDCFITFDGGLDRYYRNDSSFFNEANIGLTKTGASRGASAADFDQDGFLDVFVSSAAQSSVGLYKNGGNGNNWIQFDLEGSISNRSAVGSILKLRSEINGIITWQIREVNSQSSFCGSNALRVHFGLDTASTIDSLFVFWPSGEVQPFGSMGINQIVNIIEPVPTGYLRPNFRADNIQGIDSLDVNFSNWSIFNPSDSITQYAWDFNEDGIDDSFSENPSWNFDLSDSLYSIRLIVTNQSGMTDTLIRMDYIRVDPQALGLLDYSAELDFISFPNPFNDIIRVSPNFTGEYLLVLKNLQGKTIIKKQKSGSSSIDTESIPAGIYFLTVKNENGSSTMKLVKSK